MPTTTHSTQNAVPSEFMGWLADTLAGGLKLDRSLVRISDDETAEAAPPKVGDKLVLLVLGDPVPVNPNAGAGRHGFPLARKLIVKMGTRNVLDPAGSSEIGLTEHWDFQDRVIDALLLLSDTGKRFVNPPKYVGAGSDVKRNKNTAGLRESVFVFELNYVPKVAR